MRFVYLFLGSLAFLLGGLRFAHVIESDLVRVVVISTTVVLGGVGTMLIKRRNRARPER